MIKQHNAGWVSCSTVLGAMFAFMLLTSVRAQAGSCQGPWGGPGGVSFSDPAVAGAQIQSIYMTWGSYVESVQMNMATGALPVHGGSGPKTTSIGFSTGEYLTGITGQYGLYLDAVSFITNKKTYGPFGLPKAGLSSFSFNLAPGQTTIGFCGRAGKYIDALGIIVQ